MSYLYSLIIHRPDQSIAVKETTTVFKQCQQRLTVAIYWVANYCRKNHGLIGGIDVCRPKLISKINAFSFNDKHSDAILVLTICFRCHALRLRISLRTIRRDACYIDR